MKSLQKYFIMLIYKYFRSVSARSSGGGLFVARLLQGNNSNICNCSSSKVFRELSQLHYQQEDNKRRILSKFNVPILQVIQQFSSESSLIQSSSLANCEHDSSKSSRLPRRRRNVRAMPSSQESREDSQFVRDGGNGDGFGLDSSSLEQLEPDFNDIEPVISPTHTFNFASHINQSTLLQNFVHLGVSLFEWERMNNVFDFIVKLDFDKDVSPVLRFLVDNGLSTDRLAYFLTRNPYIFQDSIENLTKRLEYLTSKKFQPEAICNILYYHPKWLNYSVEGIDRRLGLFQKTFNFTGNEIRQLATYHPLVVTTNWNQIKNVNIKVKDEMGFEPNEIKKLLLNKGKIWTLEPKVLWRRFDLLHNDYKFTHEELVIHSTALITREARLRERIGYLQLIGRAQFNPEKPNYINLTELVQVEDLDFVIKLAKSTVQNFNRYLKTM